jgi:hypothetical protein
MYTEQQLHLFFHASEISPVVLWQNHFQTFELCHVSKPCIIYRLCPVVWRRNMKHVLIMHPIPLIQMSGDRQMD